jgi:hypothetical protein
MNGGNGGNSGFGGLPGSGGRGGNGGTINIRTDSFIGATGFLHPPNSDGGTGGNKGSFGDPGEPGKKGAPGSFGDGEFSTSGDCTNMGPLPIDGIENQRPREEPSFAFTIDGERGKVNIIRVRHPWEI